jgi:hypothetical protein
VGEAGACVVYYLRKNKKGDSTDFGLILPVLWCLLRCDNTLHQLLVLSCTSYFDLFVSPLLSLSNLHLCCSTFIVSHSLSSSCHPLAVPPTLSLSYYHCRMYLVGRVKALVMFSGVVKHLLNRPNTANILARIEDTMS